MTNVIILWWIALTFGGTIWISSGLYSWCVRSIIKFIKSQFSYCQQYPNTRPICWKKYLELNGCVTSFLIFAFQLANYWQSDLFPFMQTMVHFLRCHTSDKKQKKNKVHVGAHIVVILRLHTIGKRLERVHRDRHRLQSVMFCEWHEVQTSTKIQWFTLWLWEYIFSLLFHMWFDLTFLHSLTVFLFLCVMILKSFNHDFSIVNFSVNSIIWNVKKIHWEFYKLEFCVWLLGKKKFLANFALLKCLAPFRKSLNFKIPQVLVRMDRRHRMRVTTDLPVYLVINSTINQLN